MKNRTFEYWINAKFYFDKISTSHTAYCIYNNESEIYEVIDQNTYEAYECIDLDMWIVRSIQK